MQLNKDGFKIDSNDWEYIIVIVLIICFFKYC